jgi:hypothetical protein
MDMALPFRSCRDLFDSIWLAAFAGVGFITAIGIRVGVSIKFLLEFDVAAFRLDATGMVISIGSTFMGGKARDSFVGRSARFPGRVYFPNMYVNTKYTSSICSKIVLH